MIDDEGDQEELFRSLFNAYDNVSALVWPILLPALDPSEKPTNTTETAPVNQPSWPPRDSENVYSCRRPWYILPRLSGIAFLRFGPREYIPRPAQPNNQYSKSSFISFDFILITSPQKR